MGKEKSEQRVDPLEFEQECETWDWVRAAGVSAAELQRILREALRTKPQDYRLAA